MTVIRFMRQVLVHSRRTLEITPAMAFLVPRRFREISDIVAVLKNW